MFKPEQDLLPPEVFGLDPSHPDVNTQLGSPFTLGKGDTMTPKAHEGDKEH